MEKELKYAQRLIVGTTRLYSAQILGIYTTMIRNYNCDRAKSVRAIRETLEDEYFNGIEPEWASLEACEWWGNMDETYFVESTHTGLHTKPSIVYEWSENHVPPAKLFSPTE
tara:strand:- start:815 stop:1150 length:336 start_codon:yes stop_codon:yes gene_type:complete